MNKHHCQPTHSAFKELTAVWVLELLIVAFPEGAMHVAQLAQLSAPPDTTRTFWIIMWLLWQHYGHSMQKNTLLLKCYLSMR